jgi:hypothetical protein
VTLQNWANFIANGEETIESIIQLRNTKLEDELSRKGGSNITVLAFHVTWSRALARHKRCGAVELGIYIQTEPCK